MNWCWILINAPERTLNRSSIKRCLHGWIILGCRKNNILPLSYIARGKLGLKPWACDHKSLCFFCWSALVKLEKWIHVLIDCFYCFLIKTFKKIIKTFRTAMNWYWILINTPQHTINRSSFKPCLHSWILLSPGSFSLFHPVLVGTGFLPPRL